MIYWKSLKPNTNKLNMSKRELKKDLRNSKKTKINIDLAPFEKSISHLVHISRFR